MGEGTRPVVTETVLPNGCRLWVEEMADVRSVAAGVWFDAGSRDDPADAAGVAHLLEHMLFKGGAGRDARALAQAMDRLGGQFNAFTSKEHTCFHARMRDTQFREGLGLLADLVVRAHLDAGDLERERQVVLSELAMIADDPAETADEIFAAALWGDHGLGRPQAGTAESVSRCRAETVRRFYREHWVAARAVITVAGAVRPDEAAAAVAEAFADLPAGAPRPERPNPLPRRLAVRQFRAAEQSHLVVGAPGPCLGDPARYATEILVSALGGSPSSRLFQSLREERGLCYDVGAAAAAHADAGEVAVFVAAPPDRAPEAARLLIAEIERVQQDGLDTDELELHRAQLLAGLWMGLEGTESRMARLGRHAVAGLPLEEPDAISRRLQGVTAEDVLGAARALGPVSSWAAAFVGPRPGLLPDWRWSEAPAA